MASKMVLFKDSYEASASKLVYVKPLFDKDGNWVINMEITREEYEKNN